MERREFVKSCCITAIGIPGLSAVMSSCGTDVQYVDFTKNDSDELVVSKTEFVGESATNFVFLSHPNTRFPICLFKIKDDEFVACLMSCTHQQCQTTVVEDMYVCSCHGARFTNTGKVIKGPATKDLVTYSVRVTQTQVYISIHSHPIKLCED